MPEPTKVVAHYKDKRVLKGSTEDFDPSCSALLLVPQGVARTKAVRVELEELKALFFVRALEGNPGYEERKVPTATRKPLGRLLRITFLDGETLVGSTLEYDPQAVGFSVYPIDLKSNNTRVFVINSAVRRVTDVAFQKMPGPLWIGLTAQRRLLPALKRHNPVCSPWWALAVAVVLMPVAAVALRTDIDLPPHTKPLAFLHLPPPKFSVGTVIEVRDQAIAFRTGDVPGLEPARDAVVRGTVLDRGLSQGRWLYRLQLTPAGMAWVFEDDAKIGGTLSP